MNASPVRVFIALELPAELKAALTELIRTWQAQLTTKQAQKAVRWVQPEKMHLTLRFLGEIAPTSLPPLAEALHKAIAPFAPFALTVQGSGAFPNERRIRVLWAGCEATPPLIALQHAIEGVVRTQGYPGENRAFSAHLTLGRVNDVASETAIHAIAELVANAQVGTLGTIPVESLSLIHI